MARPAPRRRPPSPEQKPRMSDLVLTTVSEGVQIAVLKDAAGNLFGLITGQ